MTKQEQISLLDAVLAQHRGILSADEENRYIELIAASYGEGDDDSPVSLELIKLHKVLLLRLHDKSDAVNSFTIGGRSMWIDYDLRNDYTIKVQSAKRQGIQTVSFLGQDIPVDTALDMLDAVNIYAMQCSGVTEAHEAAINALTTIEAVDGYDFTVGYPEKLAF